MGRLPLNNVESEFVEALADANVRFLVIGGQAVCFHGHLRPVGDLDLFVDCTPENVSSFLGVVSGHGRLTPNELKKAQSKLTKAGVQWPLSVPGMSVDILTSLCSEVPISFETALADAEWCLVGISQIPVISLQHLIESKRPCDGEKHRLDIEALTRAIDE